VTNPKELADARTAVNIAIARLSRAAASLEEIEARLALAARRLADTEIRAPFDGVVIEKHIDVGEWIGSGDPAVEIVSTGTVEAWLTIPESLRPALIAALHGGGATRAGGTNGGGGAFTLEVRVDAIGRTFRGEAPRLVPRIDASSRNFPLVVTIADPEGVLAPGMSASAHVPTGRSGEHLLVPKDAIVRQGTGPFVYVARTLAPDAPPMSMPVPVTVHFPTGDRFAVSAVMLAPGDLVVVEGNERLFPMTPLAPDRPAAAPGAPNGAPAPAEKPSGRASGDPGAGR
jgi:RND family efflux transporter MFP subunit